MNKVVLSRRNWTLNNIKNNLKQKILLDLKNVLKAAKKVIKR